jgi:probable F420-dependent oxidoreductase
MRVATALRFGLGMPTAFPDGEPDLEFLRFAVRAEELGYDALWSGDHIVFHIPRLEIFTLLAAVAARTERIRLGPGVLLLCLRNPVHVAQAMVSLDHISNGRALFGVGVGGEHAKEFEASQVSTKDRGARTDEALGILKRLWTEPEIDHEGRFWQFSKIGVRPHPRQRPHPPIWVGGRAEAALRRTVASGDAWFPGWVTPERFRQGWSRIEALCAASGRSPETIERALYLFVSVDADAGRARAQAEAFLSRNYNMPYAPFAKYVVAGRPEECAAEVRRYLAAGPRQVTFRFATSEPMRQLELWSSEVLPALREALP